MGDTALLKHATWRAWSQLNERLSLEIVHGDERLSAIKYLNTKIRKKISYT